ncbi:hypothetical protein [Ensifer sp.]|jgi:hypothetical protein|uniref:hypothetical protein n=1 Tax=Ensifer sp. TaxID=1872086 RepID=UPI002E1477C7|nr:hypothetical protein [Ensifer sp.]
MLKGIHLTVMMGFGVPKPVPAGVVDALLSVQVTQGTEQKSGFQLSFDMGKKALVSRLFESGFFDPPQRVVIMVTTNGTINVLMDGVITRHSVNASNEPGQTRLEVLGEDISRLLDLVDLSWLIKYPAIPAEGRVALILAKYMPLGLVPVIVPSVLLAVENPLEHIPGQRGTDLQYLNLLAHQVGYVFYIDPGPTPGRSIAYWGPEIKVGKVQDALVVNSDAGSNVESATFNFEGFSKTLHLILLHNAKTKIPIPIPVPDINPLSPPLGRRMPVPLRAETVTGLSKFTVPQAAMYGLAKAARAAEVITGSGTLNVLRYGRPLKPRRLVEVRGAGTPHDGVHFVRSVTHLIKAGDYKQNFTLSRNAFHSSPT